MNTINYSLDDEIIDLEWCSKNGHKPPKGRKYRIIVDRESYVVDKECITGREILILASKTPPERFQLRQKLREGTWHIVTLDQTVCFTTPGIERFKTLPLDQTDGECLRRDFDMLPEDTEFLEAHGCKWEAVKMGGAPWVLLYDFSIPEGYNVKQANLGIRLTPGYPQAALDMAFFNPSLSRLDCKPIAGLSEQNLDGKVFQQWSRHRTPANPWIPGVDNLGTQIQLAEYWLQNEFNRIPHAVLA
jgi:hypothetical protein